jgi:hypothetical protein
MMMRNLFAMCAAAASLIALTPASADREHLTANRLLPACKAFIIALDGNVPSYHNLIERGRCVGILEGLSYMPLHICTPNGVMTDQAVRVVVKYIEEQPARWHEDFRTLALEAMLLAWPCKQ